MPGLLGLTAFATLLGVSALVPSSPGAARWPHRAARVATPIAARFDCVEPAAKPSFVIQSCVEPTNVASVPAAAGPPIPVRLLTLTLTLSLTLTLTLSLTLTLTLTLI